MGFFHIPLIHFCSMLLSLEKLTYQLLWRHQFVLVFQWKHQYNQYTVYCKIIWLAVYFYTHMAYCSCHSTTKSNLIFFGTAVSFIILFFFFPCPWYCVGLRYWTWCGGNHSWQATDHCGRMCTYLVKNAIKKEDIRLTETEVWTLNISNWVSLEIDFTLQDISAGQRQLTHFIASYWTCETWIYIVLIIGQM